MAWTTPLTAVANAALTAAQWNASVRDNLLMTAPAITTANGSLMVGNGTNAIVERNPGQNVVGTSETTASTSYTNLTTFGPVVTVTSGGRAIVIFGCEVTNSTGGSRSLMSYGVSNATTVASTDASAVTFTAPTAAYVVQCSRVIMQSLTNGSNIFTCQYRVLSGTGTWGQRNLVVVPL